jgi:hypothetical protein
MRDVVLCGENPLREIAVDAHQLRAVAVDAHPRGDACLAHGDGFCLRR